MTDRPIIFSAPMVQALLAGRKSQTRRLLKPQPAYRDDVPTKLVWQVRKNSGIFNFDDDQFRRHAPMLCPYAPGDRLYVREAHSLHRAHGQYFKTPAEDHGERWGPWSGLPIAVSPDKTRVAYYREGFDRSGPPKWRPSIHMPRWASRITLTVTEVRVQRLQEISEADAVAEGCEATGWMPSYGNPDNAGCEESIPATDAYASLWNSLHGPEAWDANPWVVAISFTVDRQNIDAT